MPLPTAGVSLPTGSMQIAQTIPGRDRSCLARERPPRPRAAQSPVSSRSARLTAIEIAELTPISTHLMGSTPLMSTFHPELRLARFIPRFTFGPRTVSWIRRLRKPIKSAHVPEGVSVEDVAVPGRRGLPRFACGCTAQGICSAPRLPCYGYTGAGSSSVRLSRTISAVERMRGSWASLSLPSTIDWRRSIHSRLRWKTVMQRFGGCIHGRRSSTSTPIALLSAE